MRNGTIVVATNISAPGSTKHGGSEPDTEQRRAKKCDESHHVMKLHISLDSASPLGHGLDSTPANFNEVTQSGPLSA